MTDRLEGLDRWSRPVDLKQQVQRLWDRGVLLRSVLAKNLPNTPCGDNGADGADGADGAVDASDISDISSNPGNVVFPLRLRLRKPASRELGDAFNEVRHWIKSLQSMRHVRVEMKEVRHPQLGANHLPYEVWIDSLEDAIVLIGKQAETDVFRSKISVMLGYDERLLKWVERQPLEVLTRHNDWERLLRLHDRMCKNPMPEIYLRQLSVPDVDTKFIESHRKILAEWLDVTLSPESINGAYRGAAGFAQRYGYCDKPARLRLRSLDEQFPLMNAPVGAIDQVSANDDTAVTSAVALADITLDIALLSKMSPSHKQVLMLENEITYLSLPRISGTLAVFGTGYGFQMLDTIPWLQDCTFYYWGDIDTDGFAILNQLRAGLPNVQSVLMDRETLQRHPHFYGKDPQKIRRQLALLSDEEQTLYHDLLDNRFGERVRLEQEHVNFEYVCAVLGRVMDA